MISFFDATKAEIQPVKTIDPDEFEKWIQVVVKRSIGTREFIRVGDQGFPIATSDLIPPGELWIVSRGRIQIKFINMEIAG